MSRAIAVSAGLVALTVLAGCPSDSSNPEVLWLATDGDELHVRLVDSEPIPF
jgi:hypothetical protein